MPYYGPLSYPTYIPPDSVESDTRVHVHDIDLPHGTLESILSSSESTTDDDPTYDDPIVPLEQILPRDPTEEENAAVIGKSFIDDDGGVYEPFLLSYDPQHKMLMAYCSRVRTFGMTKKDCQKTAYYPYDEVLQLLQLHPYIPRVEFDEEILFQPEDGLDLAAESVKDPLEVISTSINSKYTSMPDGVISPDDEALLAGQDVDEREAGRRVRRRVV
jgi:hypothetical protein